MHPLSGFQHAWALQSSGARAGLERPSRLRPAARGSPARSRLLRPRLGGARAAGVGASCLRRHLRAGEPRACGGRASPPAVRPRHGARTAGAEPVRPPLGSERRGAPSLPAGRAAVLAGGRANAWRPPWAEAPRGGVVPTCRGRTPFVSAPPTRSELLGRLESRPNRGTRAQPALLFPASPSALLTTCGVWVSGWVDEWLPRGRMLPAHTRLPSPAAPSARCQHPGPIPCTQQSCRHTPLGPADAPNLQHRQLSCLAKTITLEVEPKEVSSLEA